MGINYKTFKWLEKNIDQDNLSLGVIGRQELHLTHAEKKYIDNFDFIKSENYAERLLKKKFNLSKIDSFDKSNYEGCDVILNFEKDFSYNEKYDLFFDGGSLHHVYNIPKVIKNIIKLTKTNGKIIHSVVFNNFQGFGLYQISPELLFSIYSKKNGFVNTSVYIGTNLNNKYWYKLDNLDVGERYNFPSSDQLTVYMISTKIYDVDEIIVDQKFFLKHKIKKNNKMIEKIMNLYLRTKIILISLFPNFLLNFEDKLKKEKI